MGRSRSRSRSATRNSRAGSSSTWQDKDSGGSSYSGGGAKDYWSKDDRSANGGDWNSGSDRRGGGGSKEDDDWKKQEVWGGGGGDYAPDWECAGCGINVFAKKDTCFKCGTGKDGKKSENGGGSHDVCRFFAKAGWCKNGDTCQHRHDKTTAAGGDWDCPNCKDRQFARNFKCRKCSASRPGFGGVNESLDPEALLLERHIDAVKAFQRYSEENKETWWWWCDVNGFKEKYDPRRKDLPFLKDFVASQKVSLEPDTYKGGGAKVHIGNPMPAVAVAAPPGVGEDSMAAVWASMQAFRQPVQPELTSSAFAGLPPAVLAGMQAFRGAGLATLPTSLTMAAPPSQGSQDSGMAAALAFQMLSANWANPPQ